MKRRRIWPALLVIGIMFLLIAAYVYVSYRMIRPDADKICDGVYIEEVDISGMTRDQAAEAMDQYVQKLSGRELEVDVNGKKVGTTLEKLGYTTDVDACIDQAMQLGKEGSFFSDFAQIRALKKEHKVYDLDFSYSEKKTKKFVKNKCGKKCSNAKDAMIKRSNGTFIYTEAKEGVTVDVDATMANIDKALDEQVDTDVVRLAAVITVQEPAVTKEEAERCKDKIGTYSTSFNAGNVSRSRNVANAARLIDGSVIYPGETFSVHDTISPLTEENGYYEAPSYNNGQVVDSIGGGVCQVSTTLYNAVLRAELEVVERSPHSMMVTYVEPSMDAAIAGDYKDFKFRNNTDTPLYIEGGTYSGTIFFNVYGEETRSEDRTVTFESEVTEEIKPGADKVTYDKTKPESYMAVTQEAHTGCKAVLWKIVKEEGKKTKKTQVNSSVYQAEPRYVTRGAAKATPKPDATEKPKSDSDKDKDKGKDKDTDSNARETGAKAKPKPKPTKAPATKAPVVTKAPFTSPTEPSPAGDAGGTE